MFRNSTVFASSIKPPFFDWRQLEGLGRAGCSINAIPGTNLEQQWQF